MQCISSIEPLLLRKSIFWLVSALKIRRFLSFEDSFLWASLTWNLGNLMICVNLDGIINTKSIMPTLSTQKGRDRVFLLGRKMTKIRRQPNEREGLHRNFSWSSLTIRNESLPSCFFHSCPLNSMISSRNLIPLAGSTRYGESNGDHTTKFSSLEQIRTSFP